MFTTSQVSGATCQVSGVRCQVSVVRCQVSGVTCKKIMLYFFVCFCDDLLELYGGGSVINRALYFFFYKSVLGEKKFGASLGRVFYTRGLPHLVKSHSEHLVRNGVHK